MSADLRSGIAILKVDAATPMLPIGKSDHIEVATPVVSIGYPLDLPETPSFGMVAGIRSEISRSLFFHDTFAGERVDAAGRGRRADLLISREKWLGSLSAASRMARLVMRCRLTPRKKSGMISCGSAKRVTGGSESMSRSAEQYKEGSHAEMTEIMKDTPAFGSGVRPGDILLQVGKTQVREPEDVIDASFFITAGEKIPITVMRGDEKLTFEVEARFHPASQHHHVCRSAAMNQSIPLRLDSLGRTP